MPTNVIKNLNDVQRNLISTKNKLKIIIESIDSSENDINQRDHIVKLLKVIDLSLNDLIDIQRNILLKMKL